MMCALKLVHSALLWRCGHTVVMIVVLFFVCAAKPARASAYLDVLRFGVHFARIVFGNFNRHVQVGAQQTLKKKASA